MKVKMKEIANVIRSKNAGPYELTLDMLLKDDETFEKMRKAEVINKKVIAKLYRIAEEDVLSIVWFPNARSHQGNHRPSAALRCAGRAGRVRRTAARPPCGFLL